MEQQRTLNKERYEPPFETADGTPRYRGLPVELRSVHIAGRAFRIAGLEDAADLLDEPDFARRFVEEDRAPYGMELWPASITLAEHIMQGEDGAGRCAIELGCGLGLVSMAAALKGWSVTATDSEPTSLRFAEYNATVNHADIVAFELLDWHLPPAGRTAERIFGADLLYQLVDHVPILECVRQLLSDDGVALIADPGRGVADRFASLAADRGFMVDTRRTSATIADGREVSGRILHLRRP